MILDEKVRASIKCIVFLINFRKIFITLEDYLSISFYIYREDVFISGCHYKLPQMTRQVLLLICTSRFKEITVMGAKVSTHISH